MVLAEMTRIFEKRRSELYNLLTQRKDELKPEAQHQIYGAINEIDIFLKTIEYYRQKETDKEIKAAVLVGPAIINESRMSRFVSNINEKLSKIKLKRKKT